MKLFINDLKEKPLILDEWSERIWSVMIEKAVVNKDKSMTFVFYNKTEIIVEAE